jgi:small-conductance mechanosensitive channel
MVSEMIPLPLTIAQAAEEALRPVSDVLERVSLGTIAAIVIVLAVTWSVERVLVLVLDGLGERTPRARFFFKMLSPLIRLGLWATAFVIIVWGVVAPPIGTLFAVLAPVGIALGFGAQELVKNVIGGAVVLFDRPYQLGDRVRIGEAYGEIDHIGLRSTKLTTPDDTRVTIPNAEVLTGLVWNANSGNPDCQVVTDLFVPHDADPVEVVQVATEAAISSPYVLLRKPVVVRLQDHFMDGPYMLVRVKAYVYDHRFERAFQTDITLRAKSEFLARGMLLKWSRHDDAPPSQDLRAAAAAG